MGKKKLQLQMKPLTKKQKAIVLPVMVVIGGLAVGIAILSIIVMPLVNNNRRGVAANGFTAFVEEGTDLGAGNVVSRNDVIAALGGRATLVNDAKVSKVFNYNGDRNQTATFEFARKDGKKASLYVDMTVFKSSKSMENQHVLSGTGLARVINGHSTYYMHAQTLSNMREYRIVIINDLKAYKLVIDQPSSNVTINEISAVAALIKLAEKAQV